MPMQKGTLSYKVRIYVFTFISYMLYTASRKSLSNSKGQLSQRVPAAVLGGLDTAFLIAYAVGLFISGQAGLLVWGMIASGTCSVLIGLAPIFNTLEQPAYLIVFWGINGVCQATGWPSTIALMNKWFSKKKRGIVFGTWATNSSVGNILCGLVAAALFNAGHTWPTLFYLFSSLIVAFGIVNMFGIPPPPERVLEELKQAEEGLKHGDDYDDMEETNNENKDPAASAVEVSRAVAGRGSITSILATEGFVSLTKSKSISFFAAWKIRGVALYAISYGALKLVNYAFFFWLPFYLNTQLQYSYSASSLLSIIYDVGGMAGGTVAGLISDALINKFATGRGLVVFISLFIAPVTLFLYRLLAGLAVGANIALIFLVGFVVNGADNQITGAVSADLGASVQDAKALATVTGIINGTGSLGAAIGQLVIAVISDAFGWDTIFYILMCLGGVSCLILMPNGVNDARTIHYARKQLAASRNDPGTVATPKS